jgi:membrane-bound lytic murein transglycosylase B
MRLARSVLKVRVARALLAALLLVAAATGAAPKNASHAYAARADVQAFIDEMVRRNGLERGALRRTFAAARFQPRIVEAMQRPILEPPKWYEYAPPLLSAARVDAGVAWWNAQADALALAEGRYGVPAEIIVGIVGVESFFGRNTGRYRALDALVTLAFDYPRRAAFFRGELEHFLLLARELNVAPEAPKGSFAGALGVPQFMPGSYRTYAIDFDGDGRIDLWASGADIVGSVANFLARHDWQRGQPVLLPAAIAAEASAAVAQRLDGGITERRTLDAWGADGVGAVLAPLDLAADPVGVLLLEERSDAGNERATYWIACQNFYVLTRYNRSRLYAAAVWELGRAVKAARENAETQ